MGVKLHFFDDTQASANSSWQNEAANPYGIGALNGFNTTAADVSSIPSPYARLELFNESFELRTGDAVYRKCISHCLDVYELLFLYGKDQLTENNITVEFHSYEGNDPQTVQQNKIYYDALRSYRNSYAGGLGNFKHFYQVKYKNRVIAGTSHLTGFFCPANVPEFTINGVTYFLKKEDQINSWKLLGDRTPTFKRFLYELFKSLQLGARFVSMNNYIQQTLQNDIAGWVNDGQTMNTLFPQFNIAALGLNNLNDIGLPLGTQNTVYNGNVYVLCDNYDYCYLKYLLFPNESNVAFKLDKAQYNLPIGQRRNPMTGQQYAWIGVNDLLSDNMLVLTGEGNKEYFYTFDQDTKNGQDCSNIIVPFTIDFFKYFKKEQIGNDVTYEICMGTKKDNTHYYDVTIRVPAGGSHLSLSRRYSYNPSCNEGQISQMTLDIAIYPFVKAVDHNRHLLDNFYRIMLYTSGNKINESLTNLYMANASGFIDDNSRIENQTNAQVVRKTTTIDSTRPGYANLGTNITYIALDSKYNELSNGAMVLNNGLNKPLALDFIELSIHPSGNNNSVSFLIVPKMPEQTCNNNGANVAIDLGTSNTYVAYRLGGAPTSSYNTHNATLNQDNDVELIHLIKPVEEGEVKQRYDHLTLQHQWHEFIPSYFNTNGFKFPVPTKLNIRNLSNLDIRNMSVGNHPLASLLDVNIPFSVYEIGMRLYNNNPLDNMVSDFKWFDYAIDTDKSNQYSIFIDQLCFMLRAHLVMNHFDPRTTTLIWTYPLAFDSTTLPVITQKWEQVYKKYFSDVLPNNQVSPVISVSESRTPLLNAPVVMNAAGTKLGIDIGGGTTDLLVYQGVAKNGTTANTVKLASSFRFAGKNLFAANGTVTNINNCWFRKLQQTTLLPQPIIDGNNAVVQNARVSADPNGNNIGEIMDFVFSINNATLNTALSDPKLARIITLHNSALIYQIAVICKQAGIRPTCINFSGNGSKLLMINRKATNDEIPAINNLVNLIFMHVFNDDTQIATINIDSSPKEATAKGAINGIQGLMGMPGNMLTHTVNDDVDHYMMSVGEHLYPRWNGLGVSGFPNRQNWVANESNTKEIFTMVSDFMEFYYSLVSKNTLYGGPFSDQNLRSIITPVIIERGLTNTLNSMYGSEINDSLFLGIISEIITELVQH